MAETWARIRETIERQGAAALLSVVGTAGSVPREAGARIVLQPDGGFTGTIGGGRLEYEALDLAGAALGAGRGAAQWRDWPLGPNLAQCCGGRVTTLIETFDAADLPTVRRLEQAERSGGFVTMSRLSENGRVMRTIVSASAGKPAKSGKALARTGFNEHFGDSATPVLLFGAGHVGRALILALAPLPFAVRWIDSREDQFPRYIPGNAVMVTTEAVDHEVTAAPAGAFAVIMTHSHPLDFDLAASALKRGTFGFVGLIGSETKRVRFASWARKLGLPPAELDRLVCPIGIPQIKGKQPAVIAAAIAAQLLIALSEQAAVPGETRSSAAAEPVEDTVAG